MANGEMTASFFKVASILVAVVVKLHALLGLTSAKTKNSY